MKRLTQIGIFLALVNAGFADTITMKSGRVINGTYLGGTARTIKVEVGDRIQEMDISDISRIEFGGPSAPRVDDDRRPTLRRSDSGDTAGNNAGNTAGNTGGDRDRPVLRRAENSGGDVILRPDPNAQAAPAAQQAAPRDLVELPPGTNLVVRMIDGVDSENAHVGQTFAASLDEAVKGPN